VQSPDVLANFHPLVAGWFRERLGEPTAPQRSGWPAIAAGQDTLIAAPTGSGKTLAAFLACLDALVRDGLRAPLPDRVHILYVSPLKALSNDVHRNLGVPLAEIAARAAAAGVALPRIEVGVRTGDTPMAERERMAKRPPHILVTTPESVYIMLTTERGRAALAHVRTVIVDEIHAIAGDKRGAHLALSLERLDRLVAHTTGRAPVRVGLSATQRPIERVAALLGGRRPPPTIIDGGHRRDLDLAIEITDDELGAVASLEQMGRVYDRIAELVGQHQTTLVFVNTRRLVERVAHALEQRLGEAEVVAHHGSMARERRFQAEARLKDGSVKCAVATASLELGIDVGAVDLVVQLGSPRSLATLLQRVGRSGHSLGATPKGRLFAMTRDQLVECARAGARRAARQPRRADRARRAGRHPVPADGRGVRGRGAERGRAVRAGDRRRALRRAVAGALRRAAGDAGRGHVDAAAGRAAAAPRSRGRPAQGPAAARGSWRSPRAAPSPTTPTTR
jgi:ATP-dependent Lhr-like helicase